jgi:hypothetical protein
MLCLHKKYKGIQFEYVYGTDTCGKANVKGPFIYFIMTTFPSMDGGWVTGLRLLRR